MVPEKRAPRELSPSEKFAVKQAANRTSKIAGDAITARGVYTLLNPQSEITTVITGRYVPQATITANEAFLSESKRKADLKSSKQRNVKLKVKGKASPGTRYKSTTQYVRADRTTRGKIRVTPKGRDYLHSIETTPEREKRVARSRRYSRATIIGGRSLRYGVPVLMVGWTIHDLVKRDGDFWMQKDAESMYGRGLGTAFSYAADTLFWGGLAPLPTGPSSTNNSPVLPMIFYMWS